MKFRLYGENELNSATAHDKNYGRKAKSPCPSKGQLFDNSIHDATSLLDKKQLSNVLHISTGSIDRLVRRREIPHLKIGRLVRFRKNEIEKWLQERSSLCQ